MLQSNRCPSGTIAPPHERTPTHPQGVLDLEVPRPQDFDSFVVGDNEELVARLRAPGAPGIGTRMLYLWGGEGCGCTHLLRAWSEGVDGRYVDLAHAAAAAVLERLVGEGPSRPARLALDHVHRMPAQAQQSLFNLYNAVRSEPGQGAMLVAGDQPPARLGLRADLVTRLSWGLVYEVRPLSEASRRAAMASHARARGMAAGEDLFDWLLMNVPRDLPTLLAVLDALDRWSLAAKRPPTVALAREWLRASAARGGSTPSAETDR